MSVDMVIGGQPQLDKNWNMQWLLTDTNTSCVITMH